MAIGTKMNLLDIAKRVDPSGKTLPIAEALTQMNEILLDLPFEECNDGSGHIGVTRVGLPSVTWTQLNYGVQPSKSVTAQIKDGCGMLEAYSEVDKRVIERAKDPNSVRLQEDIAFLEAMNQEMASKMFYGNIATDPKGFTGLAPRFNLKSAASGANIVDAGGADSGGMTSIWLCGWGPQSGYALYPQNSKAGFTHEDKGQVTLLDAANGKYEGYQSHYKWDIGLHIRDWRYFVRIANIDVSELKKDATAGADLVDLMAQAVELLPNLNLVNPVFYCNQTVKSMLRRQLSNKENVSLSLDTAGGKSVMAFDNIPVRRCDKLVNTEATVS